MQTQGILAPVLANAANCLGRCATHHMSTAGPYCCSPRRSSGGRYHSVMTLLLHPIRKQTHAYINDSRPEAGQCREVRGQTHVMSTSDDGMSRERPKSASLSLWSSVSSRLLQHNKQSNQASSMYGMHRKKRALPIESHLLKY